MEEKEAIKKLIHLFDFSEIFFGKYFSKEYRQKIENHSKTNLISALEKGDFRYIFSHLESLINDIRGEVINFNFFYDDLDEGTKYKINNLADSFVSQKNKKSYVMFLDNEINFRELISILIN